MKRSVTDVIKELKFLVLKKGVSMSSIAKQSGVNVTTVRRLVQEIGDGKLIYKTHFLLNEYLDKI